MLAVVWLFVSQIPILRLCLYMRPTALFKYINRTYNVFCQQTFCINIFGQKLWFLKCFKKGFVHLFCLKVPTGFVKSKKIWSSSFWASLGPTQQPEGTFRHTFFKITFIKLQPFSCYIIKHIRTYRKVSFLKTACGFLFHSLLDRGPGELFVLLENPPKLRVGAGDQDGVENWLICSPLTFT